MKTSESNLALYKKTGHRITIGSQNRIIYTNKYGTQFIKQNGEYVLLSKKLSGGTGSRSSYTYERTPDEIQEIKDQIFNMYYDKEKYNFIVIDGLGKRFDYIIYDIRKESNPNDIEVRFSSKPDTIPYDLNIIVIKDKDFRDRRVTSYDSAKKLFKLDLSVKGIRSIFYGGKYYLMN
jgi:hypothetical protein